MPAIFWKLTDQPFRITIKNSTKCVPILRIDTLFPMDPFAYILLMKWYVSNLITLFDQAFLSKCLLFSIMDYLNLLDSILYALSRQYPHISIVRIFIKR